MERVGLHPSAPMQPRQCSDLEISAASFLHQLTHLSDKIAALEKLAQVVAAQEKEISQLRCVIQRLEAEVTTPNTARAAFEACVCPYECFVHRSETRSSIY